MSREEVFMGNKNGITMALLFLLAMPALAQVTPEVADSWYEIAIKWIMRPGLAAVAAGIVMGFAIPQWAKMSFPIEWGSSRRKGMTQLVSFLSGFLTTALLWPLFWELADARAMDYYGVIVSGLLAAVLVGVSPPFTYPAIMRFLYKRGWATEEMWSGEARAVQRRSGNGIDPKE
jgi:hypothetical protein